MKGIFGRACGNAEETDSVRDYRPEQGDRRVDQAARHRAPGGNKKARSAAEAHQGVGGPAKQAVAVTAEEIVMKKEKERGGRRGPFEFCLFSFE